MPELVVNIQADRFFRLKPGEFVAFADGKEKRVQFKKHDIDKALPPLPENPVDIDAGFLRIRAEVRKLFG
ncbi:hypothetical protein [Sinomicrobium soli]|uniref:hypothetical protein n=1 Tax=Sinomicrobium sp. N-1-3-6 TaxID=2219864 RepID=UPI000DCAE4B8|nr:hypothetical protein [Sinomicrobium sp. N-1-3-6]RAV29231.1 hypothetical protein DN748_09950 [Sinomicrobium sp. N-1-3-6]